MNSSRTRTSTTSSFQSRHTPEELWEYVTHPRYAVAFTENPCYYNQIDDGFAVKPGAIWTSVHTGEDCAGDIVICQIQKAREPEQFVFHSEQAGIKSTTTFTLERNAQGTLVTEEHRYAISLGQFRVLHLVTWLMLATGLLTRMALDQDTDLFWFERMEEAAGAAAETTTAQSSQGSGSARQLQQQPG